MTQLFRFLGPILCFVLAAAPLEAAPRDAAADRADAVVRRYQLAGEVLIARGGQILFDRGYGEIAPSGGAKHRAGERWRLASITKQVTAALLLRDHIDALDRPWLQAPWSGLAGFRDLTLRQLLTHHSGLANPDTSVKSPNGLPYFYTVAGGVMMECYSQTPRPGSSFSYNNCDYLVASHGRRIVWPSGMTMAKPSDYGLPGFISGKPEPRFHLGNYGEAGGLIGSARAVYDFDRSLMTGTLLSPAALAELWRPEGNGSYQALGQWVFPGQLAGCAKPKRIVQRDGEIFGVQARNFILPDHDLVVIVFTNRSSDDFAMGEVWQGKGFVYDLLSAAACP